MLQCDTSNNRSFFLYSEIHLRNIYFCFISVVVDLDESKSKYKPAVDCKKWVGFMQAKCFKKSAYVIREKSVFSLGDLLIILRTIFFFTKTKHVHG